MDIDMHAIGEQLDALSDDIDSLAQGDTPMELAAALRQRAEILEALTDRADDDRIACAAIGWGLAAAYDRQRAHLIESVTRTRLRVAHERATRVYPVPEPRRGILARLTRKP